MLMRRISLAILLICCAIEQQAFAQMREWLPQGVGVYRFGYRIYEPQTERYNEQGNLESIGAANSSDFTGASLIRGVGGEELETLARALSKFGGANDSGSVLDSFRLGRVNTDIEGNISAMSLGLGFGLLDNLTTFLAVPYVKADIKSDIQFKGSDNVDEVRARIGDLAFEALKSGLERAQSISTQQIKDGIVAKGYTHLDGWQYQGIGDVMMGTSLGGMKYFSPNFGGVHMLRTTLNIPTGHYDDPDILTDVSLGKGYYLLSNQYIAKLYMRSNYWIGFDVSYGYGFATTVRKRVPEKDETLVEKDRTADVDLQPGADYGYAGSMGYRANVLGVQYRLGVYQHERDHYSGPIEGNYDRMSKGTDSSKFYHEPGFVIDTAQLYAQKKFPVPFVLTLTAHFPIAARNSMNERYYDMGIASFFSTPLATQVREKSRYKDAQARAKARHRSMKVGH